MKYISLLIKHHAGPTGDVLILKNANGVWEFPGGKVRTNETAEDAAKRIAADDLGMTIKPGILIMIGRKKPADGFSEHIICGNINHNTHSKDNYHEYYDAVDVWQTEPKVDCEYKWVHPSELGEYEYEGDDVNFMAKYDPWVNPRFIPDRRMF